MVELLEVPFHDSAHVYGGEKEARRQTLNKVREMEDDPFY